MMQNANRPDFCWPNDYVFADANLVPAVGFVYLEGDAVDFGASLSEELRIRIQEAIEILRSEFPTGYFLVDVDENDSTMEDMLCIQIQDDQSALERTLKLASIYDRLPITDSEVVVVG